MRVRHLGKVILTVTLTLVFLAVSLLPDLSHPRPAYAGGNPPLPVPEDPVGQQPEQASPESAISVDVRDGHITARVVDIWGPGRSPHVVRSYTNAAEASTSAAGGWQFNLHLDVQPTLNADGAVTGYVVREPDGNRTSYRLLTPGGQNQVWVDDVGSYTTLEINIPCVIRGGEQECAWDGYYTVRLPKGVSRKFFLNPHPNQAIPVTATLPGLIQEERDANGNVTTFTWTTLPSAIRSYIASMTDPVGRVTTFTYEQFGAFECLQRDGEGGRCTAGGYHYRVRTATDPYGRQATYTYDGSGRLSSVTNAAGRITSYTYDGSGLLTGLTNARGYTTSLQWSSNKVTRVTAPDGTATVYAYPSATQTVVTNARGHNTTSGSGSSSRSSA